jgi:hypothetical protein
VRQQNRCLLKSKNYMNDLDKKTEGGHTEGKTEIDQVCDCVMAALRLLVCEHIISRHNPINPSIGTAKTTHWFLYLSCVNLNIDLGGLIHSLCYTNSDPTNVVQFIIHPNSLASSTTMKSLLFVLVGALLSDSIEAAAGWRTPSSSSTLVTPNSVISGFHKYVCKLNYDSYTSFGSLGYDGGNMACENYAMINSKPTVHMESNLVNFKVLDASAPESYNWAPATVRNPILSGLAKPFGKDSQGNDVYVCRAWTSSAKTDTASGSYQQVNGNWACLIPTPTGPLTVKLGPNAEIDLLILN